MNGALCGALVLLASVGAVPLPAQTTPAPPAGIELSANPVRQPDLFVHWPAATGRARVDILSPTGTLVASALVDNDPGRFSWNLRNSAGADVANGAYLIVVTRADGVRFRRRVVVAR